MNCPALKKNKFKGLKFVYISNINISFGSENPASVGQYTKVINLLFVYW